MGIGSKIKEILDFKGIKQKKFAEMINETTVNVNRYINEQRQIPNSLLPTIAKELNISIDELLDGESAIKVLAIDKEAHIMQFVPYNSSETFKTKTIRLDDEETIERLTYHKVVIFTSIIAFFRPNIY